MFKRSPKPNNPFNCISTSDLDSHYSQLRKLRRTQRSQAFYFILSSFLRNGYRKSANIANQEFSCKKFSLVDAVLTFKTVSTDPERSFLAGPHFVQDDKAGKINSNTYTQ